jgi:hypothetical protein
MTKRSSLIIIKKYLETPDEISPGSKVDLAELREFKANVPQEEIDELGRQAEEELERLGVPI